jgi:hypothetical protein
MNPFSSICRADQLVIKSLSFCFPGNVLTCPFLHDSFIEYRIYSWGRHQWLTLMILATQEAEIRRIEVWSQPGQMVREIVSWKYPTQNRAGGVAKWWSACLASVRPYIQTPTLPSPQQKKTRFKSIQWFQCLGFIRDSFFSFCLWMGIFLSLCVSHKFLLNNSHSK